MGINPPSLYACFGNKEGLLKAALDRYTKLRRAWMDEVVAAPTARDVAERMLMGIADKQTDPANPPGCLLVQGGIATGTGSENVPFELAARRTQTEDQLRDRFVRAKAEGDLSPNVGSRGARAIRVGRLGRDGRSGIVGLRPRSAAAGRDRGGAGVRRTSAWEQTESEAIEPARGAAQLFMDLPLLDVHIFIPRSFGSLHRLDSEK